MNIDIENGLNEASSNAGWGQTEREDTKSDQIQYKKKKKERKKERS